jgi:hypothetical protein
MLTINVGDDMLPFAEQAKRTGRKGFVSRLKIKMKMKQKEASRGSRKRYVPGVSGANAPVSPAR